MGLVFARKSLGDRFPVRAQSGVRYFVDAHAEPFPLLGRKCGLLYRVPSVSAYTSVLDDTVAKGFNAIELKLPVGPSSDNGDGKDSAGNWPFLKALDGSDWDGSAGAFVGDPRVFEFPTASADAADFSTPNSAYWANVDAFFAAASARGLLVCWFPAYVGFYNTDWWMLSITANGATKMQTYGAFIANRYQNQKNIVWMLGGDKGTAGISGQSFTSQELAALTGFHAGLKSVTTLATQYSAEWERGSITKDLFSSDMTTNGTYAAALDINNQGARAWAFSPPVPAFCQEYPFEGIGSPGIVRRLTMWAWLSTIGGYIFGHGVFTDFATPTYLSFMNTQATLDTARLNALIRTLSWWLLAPDNAAISLGGGTANQDDQVAVATASNGSLLVAYLPPAHTGTVTLTMSRMRGATLSRWWDPTTGTFTADASGLSASGTHAFTRPGNNAAGDADWLLVLTA